MASPQLRDLESALPKDKPALAEVAAMPFPLSMVAMRKFYNKDWHKPESDGETPGKWQVNIKYTTRSEEFFDCEVVAMSEDEAKKLGEAKFDKSSSYDDEIEEITVEFLEQNS